MLRLYSAEMSCSQSVWSNSKAKNWYLVVDTEDFVAEFMREDSLAGIIREHLDWFDNTDTLLGQRQVNTCGVEQDYEYQKYLVSKSKYDFADNFIYRKGLWGRRTKLLPCGRICFFLMVYYF